MKRRVPQGEYYNNAHNNDITWLSLNSYINTSIKVILTFGFEYEMGNTRFKKQSLFIMVGL